MSKSCREPATTSHTNSLSDVVYIYVPVTIQALLICQLTIPATPKQVTIVYLFFLLWKSSDPKGKFSFDAFIMNDKVLLYLY